MLYTRKVRRRPGKPAGLALTSAHPASTRFRICVPRKHSTQCSWCFLLLITKRFYTKEKHNLA